MPDRTPVVFTLSELWLLQGKVRHEIAGREQWQTPPADRELNDQVAMALLFCEDNSAGEACLALSIGDCLVLDYVVPQDAKDSEGRALGKPILRKTFAARRALLGLDLASTAEEPADSQVDVPLMMSMFESQQKGRTAD